MTPQQRHRVLVIGAGSIGSRHLRVVHGLGFDVMGCDSDPKAFARVRADIPDLPTFSDLHAALAAQPHIAIVATPHHLHAPQTAAAMAAGAHVLCEKPMADTVAAADAMIEAARVNNKVLHIGFTNRYNPCLLRIKELIEAGALGTIVAAQADVGAYVTLINSRSRYQARTFGALLLDYTHQLDFVPWLVGAPVQRIYAIGRNLGAFDLGSNPNLVAMILEHAGGALGEIHLDYCRHPVAASLSLIGDKGWATSDLTTNRLTVANRQENTRKEETLAFERDDMFRAQFMDFVAAVEGRPSRIVSGQEGRCSMLLAEAALTSLHSQMPIGV
jgi:UDP-N-acetylglucosamine 3-dehydrogenase